MLPYALDRLKQPATYAGAAAVLALTGVRVNGEMWEAIVSACVAIAGLISVLAPAKKE